MGKNLKLRLVSVLIGMMLLILLTFHIVAEDSVTINDIATGIKYHRSLIKDIKLNYRIETDLGKKPEFGTQKYTSEFNWALKGEKEFSWSKITYEDDATLEQTFAYDGEVTTSWYHPNKKDDPGSGRIMLHNTLSSEFTPKCIAFTIHNSGLYWDKVLTNGTAQILGKEKINEYECYVVEGETSPGRTSVKYKVWIDTNRGFSPLKFEVFIPNRGVLTSCDAIKLKEFAGNIWLPIKGIGRPGEAHPLKGAQYVLTVDEESVEINTGIPDDFFHLKWKEGVTVWDETQDTEIIIREEENK